MAGIKIVDLPALGRDLAATDLLELSLAGGTGSRKITGQEIMNASKLSVGNTPIINGAVGQVLFQGTGNVLQESANLFWDNTNARLGIGVTNPSQKLSIVGNNSLMFTGVSAQNMPAYIGTDSSDNFYVYSAGQGSGKTAYYGPSSGTHMRTIANFLDLYVGNGSPILGLRLNSTGNILIGTTTDAGYKLDVNGTARFQSSARTSASFITPYAPNSSSYVGLTTDFAGTNGFIVPFGESPYGAGRTRIINTYSSGAIEFYTSKGTDYLVSYSAMFAASGNLLINTTTDNGYKLDVNGTARVQGNLTLGIDSNTALSTSLRNSNSGSSSSTEINIGNDSSAFIGSLATFSSTFSTPFVRNSICLISSAYDVLIGTNLNVASGGANVIKFSTGGSNAAQERMRIFSTGNVGINTTTDAGFRLDVNGTARIQGTTTLNDVATCLQGLRVNGGYTAFNASTILGSASQSGNTFNFSTQYIGGATGTTNYFNFSGTLASGTGGSFNVFNVQQTFSNTNSSQTFRGFYYNPNITGLQAGTAHWAIHTTSGRVRFEGLPTSPTGLNAGDIYNDGGTLRIV